MKWILGLILLSLANFAFAQIASQQRQNLTNYQNPTRPGYNTLTNEITYGYNTSIIPVISYTIDF